MITAKLRALLMALPAALLSACVLVEDFEGYGALQAPPNLACAVVPCGGNGGACEPVVLDADIRAGSLSSDAQSLVVKQYQTPGAIFRVPKPGCSVPPLDLGGLRLEWAVVSHDYLAWTQRGNDSTCIGSNLSWCDPRSCEPQTIPVLGQQPEFEKLAGIALGDDYLYYSLTDGLVGRVAKGSTAYETLWIDPEYKEGMVSPLLYDMRFSGGRLYFTRFAMGSDVPNSCDDGEQAMTGGVYAIDPVVGAEEDAIVANESYVSTLDVSDEYVFFYAQNGALLSRAPKAGGAVESILPEGELVLSNPATDYGLAVLPPIEVQGSWVYFGASTMDGGKAIARVPANGSTFTTKAAEIVARPTGWFHFVVDAEALYWIECDTSAGCEKGRLLAFVPPP